MHKWCQIDDFPETTAELLQSRWNRFPINFQHRGEISHTVYSNNEINVISVFQSNRWQWFKMTAVVSSYSTITTTEASVDKYLTTKSRYHQLITICQIKVTTVDSGYKCKQLAIQRYATQYLRSVLKSCYTQGIVYALSEFSVSFSSVISTTLKCTSSQKVI